MAKKKKKKAKRKPPPKTATIKPVPDEPKITEYPDGTKPVSEFEKVLDEQIGAEKDVGKRPRGRPRRDAPPVPGIAKPDVPIDIVEAVLRMPFDLWGLSQGQPSLKLKDNEAEQLAKTVKPLLDYYLPYIPQIGYAWMAFVATTYWIAKPRFELIAAAKKEKKSSAKPAPVSPNQDNSVKPPAQGVINFPKEDELHEQNI